MSVLAGIASTLLGGILSNNQASRERERSVDDVKNQFLRLREAAELGGYNPLAVLGMGSGVPNPSASSAAFMGSAIADSGLMLADHLAKTQSQGTLAKVNSLQMENTDLLGRLTAATLRPTVPGVFNRPGGASAFAASPPLRSALGVSNGQDFPQVFDSAGPVRGPAGASGVFSSLETSAASDDGTLPGFHPFRLFGMNLYPSGDNSDMASGENRYGESTDFLGIGATIYDTAWNFGRAIKNGSWDPKYRDRRFGDPGSPASRAALAATFTPYGKGYQPSTRGDGYDRLTGSSHAERFR